MLSNIHRSMYVFMYVSLNVYDGRCGHNVGRINYFLCESVLFEDVCYICSRACYVNLTYLLCFIIIV